MQSTYPDNWPLQDEFLIELGRITALWASLESLLNVCLGKLAGFDAITDPTPFIFITHASFPQRLDMLGALCEQLKSVHSHLEADREVVAKLKAAQTLRNRFTHNGITFDPEKNENILAQGSARGKVKTSVTPVTAADLHAAAKEVHLASLALYKLVFKRDMPPIWSRGNNTTSTTRS